MDTGIASESCFRQANVESPLCERHFFRLDHYFVGHVESELTIGKHRPIR
jgi:hypothetical protein